MNVWHKMNESSLELISLAFRMFIGGLMVALTIEHCNLHRRIALRVLMVVGAGARWSPCLEFRFKYKKKLIMSSLCFMDCRLMLGFMLTTAVQHLKIFRNVD